MVPWCLGAILFRWVTRNVTAKSQQFECVHCCRSKVVDIFPERLKDIILVVAKLWRPNQGTELRRSVVVVAFLWLTFMPVHDCRLIYEFTTPNWKKKTKHNIWHTNITWNLVLIIADCAVAKGNTTETLFLISKVMAIRISLVNFVTKVFKLKKKKNFVMCFDKWIIFYL